MYHSWAVGVQRFTEVGIVQGATGMEGHKSLEIENHSPKPSLGITLGAGAKAAKARRAGAGLACSDSLTRLPSPPLLAGLGWPLYTDPPDTGMLAALVAVLPGGAALATCPEREGACPAPPREEVAVPGFRQLCFQILPRGHTSDRARPGSLV